MSTPDAGGGQRHRRLLGLWRNPSVRREIAALDAQRDCQRIVHLLTAYEFPADIQRATELALFHTYGSQSISALLDRTGQFSKLGQKRYDDTRLLIAQFMESGWASSAGQRSIAQMNHIHAHYRIDNEDFLFVLWTFIDFPLRWLDAFGWRRFTAHERQAWFHYWVEIGRRMRLQHIPGSPEDFDAFVQDYEARQLHHAPANERVAQATIAIMAAWLQHQIKRRKGTRDSSADTRRRRHRVHGSDLAAAQISDRPILRASSSHVGRQPNHFGHVPIATLAYFHR
ncbi:oxygenase MpaB family protein [Aquabacterium sp.]|uniref:oxygenase MpaB family protein n=1 Tax=Aquabacterium sp. TaxID=1872578 RepID=UPI004037866F